MDKLLLRPVEVSDAIGLGRSNVYSMIASGELPSIRIGGSVRVPRVALQAWIDRKLTERAALNEVSAITVVHLPAETP